MNKISIFIVDNEKIAIDSLKIVLGTRPNFEVVGTAAGGAEAIAAMSKISGVDIVIMDLFMRPLDGIKTMQKIRKTNISSKPDFLIYSFENNWDFANKSIEAGARGYIVRDSPINVLTEALIKIYEDDNIVAIDPSIRRPKQSGSENIAIPDFDENDLFILKCLVRGHTTREIAIKLFKSSKSDINSGKDLKIEQTKIETIINDLRKKTNTRNQAHLIRYVLENSICPDFEIIIKNQIPAFIFTNITEQYIPFFVIDDHTGICEGIPDGLLRFRHPKVNFDHIASSTNGQAGLNEVRSWAANQSANAGNCNFLVILDIQMPKGISGLEVARMLRQEFPQARVVILTSKDNYHFAKEMIMESNQDQEEIKTPGNAGDYSDLVNAYILKEISIENLIKIIISVWTNDNYRYLGVTVPEVETQHLLDPKLFFIMQCLWNGLDRKETSLLLTEKYPEYENNHLIVEKLKREIYNKSQTDNIADLINFIWRNRIYEYFNSYS